MSSFPEKSEAVEGTWIESVCDLQARQREDAEIERRWPGHHGACQGQSPGKSACFGGPLGSPVLGGQEGDREGAGGGRDRPGSPAAAAQSTAGTTPPPAEDARRGADRRGVSFRALRGVGTIPDPRFPSSRPAGPHRPARHQPRPRPRRPPQPRLSRRARRPTDLTSDRCFFRLLFSNCAEGTD